MILRYARLRIGYGGQAQDDSVVRTLKQDKGKTHTLKSKAAAPADTDLARRGRSMLRPYKEEDVNRALVLVVRGKAAC